MCVFFCSLLVEKRLVDEVRKNGILIIVGETGSGKTTRMFDHILMHLTLYICASIHVYLKKFLLYAIFSRKI